MEYTKDDLRKAFNEILDDAEKKGCLDVADVRGLTDKGIPILNICRDKGVFDAIRFRFEKWLNSL